VRELPEIVAVEPSVVRGHRQYASAPASVCSALLLVHVVKTVVLCNYPQSALRDTGGRRRSPLGVIDMASIFCGSIYLVTPNRLVRSGQTCKFQQKSAGFGIDLCGDAAKAAKEKVRAAIEAILGAG
jgi:hypothetical protein